MKAMTLTSIVLLILVASLATPQQSFARDNDRTVDIGVAVYKVFAHNRAQKAEIRVQDAEIELARRERAQEEQLEAARIQLARQERELEGRVTNTKIEIAQERYTTQLLSERAEASIIEARAKIADANARGQVAEARIVEIRSTSVADLAELQAQHELTMERMRLEFELKLEEQRLNLEKAELLTDSADAEAEVLSEAETTLAPAQVHPGYVPSPELAQLMEDAELTLKKLDREEIELEIKRAESDH